MEISQAIPNGKGETAAIVTREVRLSDVALRLLSNVIDDLHVNASGAVFFSMLAVGVIWPEHKQQCVDLAALAGTYLFASANNK